jgi:putative endonuclease
VAAWFVYLVRCRDGSLYTGISTDVPARLAKHNLGRASRYTRGRTPVTLVHLERRPSRSSALRREAAIKALSRSKKLSLARHPEVTPNLAQPSKSQRP